MHQHAQVVALGSPEGSRRLRQSLRPSSLPSTAIDPQRLDRTVFAVQALVRVAVTVGQPALVHRFVVARHGAQHFAATHVQEQVRTHRVVVAQRFARGQFGRARNWNTFVGHADRAERRRRCRTAQWSAACRRRYRSAGSRRGTYHRFIGTGNVGGEADAGALDAAGHLGGDQRAHVLVRHHALALVEAADRTAIAQRNVLQLAARSRSGSPADG